MLSLISFFASCIFLYCLIYAMSLSFCLGSDGKLSLFGSSLTGAGLKDSDINICFEKVQTTQSAFCFLGI